MAEIENMSIDGKPNPLRRDDSDDSVDSAPERDQNPRPSAADGAAPDAQQPKKKGGRKPIYATSEERKQRNRQAQAAFRERRTEYIKHLEETIRVHEANMHNLQTANRTASEECLMLQYKNSLFERILLEKGIDVQAELHAKTGNPSRNVPQNLVQPPAPILRAIINPHHRQRKSISSIAPKTEPGITPLTSTLPPHKPTASPKSQLNPSLVSSPSHAPLAFSPAPSDTISMRGPLTGLPRQSISASTHHVSRPSLIHAPRNPTAGTGASFYPTLSFPNHMGSLDTEYDRQCDMVEDSEMDTPNDNGAYPPAFTNENQQPAMLLSPTSTVPGHHISSPHERAQSTPMAVNSFPSITQHLLDQSLDWDSFGLSESMAFPSQHAFQFDRENMR